MVTHRRVLVGTARPYTVHVGAGLLREVGRITSEIMPGLRWAILADEHVAALYAPAISEALEPGRALVATFLPGEGSKTREEWSRLTDLLSEAGFGRDGAIAALGGGVTGDLAGFVAATFMRGVPYIQIPTTLLAMVDSSVGGKTGVDTAAGKNQVGIFHQPTVVIADVSVLRTLPDTTFREGLAEAVKHGVVADAQYLDWIEQQADALLARDENALTQLVARSVEIKAGVVTRDEREAGERAVLNFGHTVGHAIEHVSGYSVAHGEAVAAGMVAEARLGESMGETRHGFADRISAICARFGLPTAFPELTGGAILAAMRADKKNLAGSIRCCLVSDAGVMARDDAGRWTHEVSDRLVLAALQ